MAEIPDGPIRNRVKLYLELAAQAERDAHDAGSKEDGAAYLRLAEQWRALAADAQRSIKREK